MSCSKREDNGLFFICFTSGIKIKHHILTWSLLVTLILANNLKDPSLNNGWLVPYSTSIELSMRMFNVKLNTSGMLFLSTIVLEIIPSNYLSVKSLSSIRQCGLSSPVDGTIFPSLPKKVPSSDTNVNSSASNQGASGSHLGALE